MVTRRALTFDTLGAAARDAEHLLAAGYDRAGSWDLAQCLDHLAAWLTYPVSGFPRMPLLLRPLFALVRATLGRGMLNKYLREGMPAGKPTMPQSVGQPGGDPAAALGRFKAAAERFEAHAGDYLPSPLFGPLTRDEALKVQLAHAAHHLSFLVPKR
ncbi:DUF1569 domain-containing protein [Urbifossiella limnaea]|uniref:DUF1569 domain-containing protein n=1 Tax=Urbifossiella limnaea TaxID=2528023 RepID=A0A517Y2M6_9BACT|nr:DUF1569 domain-containing protein [Urbifossiella limnaea]QDU24005.1 hypothetical protein ETAA1_60160 [Urbifossiella limnaea]